MKLSLIASKKLGKSPVAICSQFQRVYVSTKGRRIFYTEDMEMFKSVLFSSQVNSFSKIADILFCCQKDGAVFALTKDHKTARKIHVGDAGCIQSLTNNTELYISTGKKIAVFTTADLSPRPAYFISDLPIVTFDVSDENIAAGVLNDPNIQVVSKISKAKTVLKLPEGFPEIVKFIKNDVVVVGSTTGVLSIFSTVNMKRISFLKFKFAPTAIQILSSTRLLVGMKFEVHLVDISQFNRMESIFKMEVAGIPVDFWGDGPIYCAVSRESRFGRWDKCTSGQNQIIKMAVEDD